MKLLDQLSDVTYRDRAAEIVDRFVDECRCPITRSQINGLRQIAIQQPLRVKAFADHQRQRAEKKHETASQNAKATLESQIAFWKLVADLCETNKLPWSPATEVETQMPGELREENIPTKADCKSNEERGRRKQLKSSQKQWLDAWNNQHLPEFFRRFCIHYLYRLGRQEHSNKE
ncbi:MAG: hypothetical protein WD049_05535 [Candidatus Paceibacterota bacterium]